MQKLLRIGMQFFAAEDEQNDEIEETENVDDVVDENDENDDITLEDDDDDGYEEDEDDDDFLDDSVSDNFDDEDDENQSTNETVDNTNSNAEIEGLRAKIAAYERHKDTLKKLGVNVEGDTLKALETIAAENEGMTVEEYNKSRIEKAEYEEFIAYKRSLEFNAKANAELVGLKKEFAEIGDVKHLHEIPNFAEYARYRDRGLTESEAFILANNGRTKIAQAYAKQKAINDSKAHLRSNVPSGVGNIATTSDIPAETLKYWQELYPEKSKREIIALYNRTK